MSNDPWVRRALPSEAELAASVLIASRRAAVPAIPPPIHPDAEVLVWFREVVMPTHDVWVAGTGSTIVGVMVRSDGWIDHLYVAPDSTDRGIGSALVLRAKTESHGSLDLWTFASNMAAQRFYERHGFLEVGRTDGDNEEGEPDIRYRWSNS